MRGASFGVNHAPYSLEMIFFILRISYIFLLVLRGRGLLDAVPWERQVNLYLCFLQLLRIRDINHTVQTTLLPLMSLQQRVPCKKSISSHIEQPPEPIEVYKIQPARCNLEPSTKNRIGNLF
jgi:hypothetical protein